jgi:hypothetical protein
MVASLAQYDTNINRLNQHIQNIRDAANTAFPGHVNIEEAMDKATTKDLLGKDLPIVYFYCHGERPKPGDQNTYISIGLREKLEPKLIKGWFLEWHRDQKIIWDKIRPLIFINACHSLEINPQTITSYLDAFVGVGHAAGIIGTEVKVNQELAIDVAQQFFEKFFRGLSVDEAFHSIKLDYLASGNLFGLVYSYYCWANLHLSIKNTTRDGT